MSDFEAQKKLLLDALDNPDSGGMVFFDDKHALGRWQGTLARLCEEGIITTELVEIDEQYSRLEVRRKTT